MSIIRRECATRPGRLWSLWDIMEKFEPGWLIRLSHTLTRLAASRDMRIRLRETNILPAAFGDLALICARLGLRVSNSQAHDLHNLLVRDPVFDITLRLNSLIETIETEMRAQYFIELRYDKIEFIRHNKPHFGNEFASKFPSASYDLDEAGKCLAFERPTAAVFHLMRIMEIGLRATARCLMIPDPTKTRERNWGVMLGKIETQLNAKWPASSRLSGDGVLFEAVFGSLDAVKMAWRHPTMHVENKYTDDEAMYIFHVVKGCMMKIAGRMDENGMPKA